MDTNESYYLSELARLLLAKKDGKGLQSDYILIQKLKDDLRKCGWSRRSIKEYMEEWS